MRVLNDFKDGGKKEETGTAEEGEDVKDKIRNREIKRSRETVGTSKTNTF